MKFTPKTDDELAMDGLLQPGIYPFVVAKAEDTTSKRSGNDMLKLQLEVYGDGSRKVHVFDYLMESVADRLAKFCKNVGLGDKYDSGELDAYDCEGKEGWVCIKIQPAKDAYEPKNIVSYYCQKPERPTSDGPTPGAAKASRQNLDDLEDVPF